MRVRVVIDYVDTVLVYSFTLGTKCWHSRLLHEHNVYEVVDYSDMTMTTWTSTAIFKGSHTKKKLAPIGC